LQGSDHLGLQVPGTLPERFLNAKLSNSMTSLLMKIQAKFAPSLFTPFN
jgi:hypothetical protein